MISFLNQKKLNDLSTDKFNMLKYYIISQIIHTMEGREFLRRASDCLPLPSFTTIFQKCSIYDDTCKPIIIICDNEKCDNIKSQNEHKQLKYHPYKSIRINNNPLNTIRC